MSRVSPPSCLGPEVKYTKTSNGFEEKSQIFGRKHIKGRKYSKKVMRVISKILTVGDIRDPFWHIFVVHKQI